MITRSVILTRSLSRGLETVSYSQNRIHPDGYRCDCSGYVCMCWKTATSGPGTWGGYSTSTLVTYGVMYEIPWSELRPGDAIGRCGPGTDSSGAGNGHIMLWLGKEGTRHRVRDHGSGMGPKERLVTPPSDYKAYRFVDVEGGSVNPNEINPDQFPLPVGHYFGNIAGPNESHGGGVASDIPYIRAIQQRLEDLGFDLGIVDGKFGSRTESAVRAFQGSRNLTVDGQIGPATWKALFTPVVVVPPPTTPPDPVDPVSVILARIESKIDALAARPPVVAQVDTSSLADVLEDILTRHEELENISPEAITEAVKQAFREGTD